VLGKVARHQPAVFLLRSRRSTIVCGMRDADELTPAEPRDLADAIASPCGSKAANACTRPMTTRSPRFAPGAARPPSRTLAAQPSATLKAPALHLLQKTGRLGNEDQRIEKQLGTTDAAAITLPGRRISLPQTWPGLAGFGPRFARFGLAWRKFRSTELSTPSPS
jgi:hypothetical protein